MIAQEKAVKHRAWRSLMKALRFFLRGDGFCWGRMYIETGLTSTKYFRNSKPAQQELLQGLPDLIASGNANMVCRHSRGSPMVHSLLSEHK
jgi:hypothetical protein